MAPDRDLSRREFLVTSLQAGAMVALSAGMLDGCPASGGGVGPSPTPGSTGATLPVPVSPAGPGSPTPASPAGLARVAATSQLTGTPSPFQVQGSTVYAFLSGNQPIVLSNVCPHEGCSVNWNPARSQFVCPCHGSVFDGKGQFVSGPAGAPLPNLHAQVQNGDVFVQTT